MKFYKLSWDELEKYSFELYKKIKDSKFDRILCISRGGLVWARMFSDLMNLPVSHLTVTSYQHLKQQKETKITETPNNLKNQRFLVIDEIVDSGKTLKLVLDYLKAQNITHCKTLTPIVRTFSQPLPDFYLKVIDEWIIFPYETRETCQAFLKLYKNPAKAREKLLELGFNKNEVDLII